MLEAARALLADLRRNRARWDEVACTAVKQDDADDNQAQRAGVWAALQYDRRPDDLPLLRDLLAEEVLAHERDLSIGITHGLRIGAYLVARHRDAADLALLWRAKHANFDTGIGLDVEHLFAAGHGAAIAGAAALGDPELIERLAAESLEEVDLDDWWRRMDVDFPEREEEESLWVQSDRAIELGAVAEGIALVDALARDLSDEPNDLATVARLREELGQIDEALSLCRRVAERGDGDGSLWDQVARWQHLATLLVRHGRFAAAWEALQRLAPRLDRFDDWKPVGLGRFVVDAAIAVAVGLDPADPMAGAALTWAASLIQRGCSSFPALRERGISAAAYLGDTDARSVFERAGN